MDTSFIFLNCYTGIDFENLVMSILNENGFTAKKTGSNDGGIDIVAESITKPKTYPPGSIQAATHIAHHWGGDLGGK